MFCREIESGGNLIVVLIIKRLHCTIGSRPENYLKILIQFLLFSFMCIYSIFHLSIVSKISSQAPVTMMEIIRTKRSTQLTLQR